MSRATTIQASLSTMVAILAMEVLWKRKLRSREMGLNKD
jgi:hypothetical protein